MEKPIIVESGKSNEDIKIVNEVAAPIPEIPVLEDNPTEQIEEVRAQINQTNETNQVVPTVSVPKINQKEYFDKNLPDYLGGGKATGSRRERVIGKVVGGVASAALSLASKIKPLRKLADKALKSETVVGKENIPDGPCIFVLVSHNFKQGEPWQLMGALLERRQRLHIVSAATLNWSDSTSRAMQMGMGFLPIHESMDPATMDFVTNKDDQGNKIGINEERLNQYLNLIGNQDPNAVDKGKDPAARDGYERVIRQQFESGGQSGLGSRLDEINSMVATLLKGEDLAIAAQGLFSYKEGEANREDFAGFALIAQQYQKKAQSLGIDQPLNIIPVYCHDRAVEFGTRLDVNEDASRDEYMQQLNSSKDLLIKE